VPREIGVDEVQRLLREEEAQVVEVLPEQEYREEHLPGAIHIPLKRLSVEAASRIDKTRPVIVYCWDDA
jgi:rhodanese-related sulfurtransferase